MRQLSFLFAALLLFGCAKSHKPVSFREQIQPILAERCVSCHGAEKARGKVVLTSYETFIKSRTVSGKEPLAIAGNPGESRLFVLCATQQVHFRMPPDTTTIPPLTQAEVELVGKWIQQGMQDN